jgi:hypothetical protein
MFVCVCVSCRTVYNETESFLFVRMCTEAVVLCMHMSCMRVCFLEEKHDQVPRSLLFKNL